MRQARWLQDLAELLAGQVRDLTGFDRVMVYRFEPDGHGVVIAESVAEGWDSFLGLHYPASDVPQQARRLYVENWLRLVADVTYRSAAITPPDNPLTGCST